MKTNFKKACPQCLKHSFCRRGFTILELLVVVAMIGILSAIVLTSLSKARYKGGDGGVKSNLRNAISQGEIFYGTNTAAVNTYTGVCTNPGPVGGAKTVAEHMLAAVKAAGLTTYVTNAIGTGATATCNDSATLWAAEVPLRGAGVNQMWCVDSSGKSKQETGS